MRFSPTSAIKKPYLPDHLGGSRNTMLFRLESSLGTLSRNCTNHRRPHSESELVLQRCLRCVHPCGITGGRYAISDGKADTYPIEGNNAELRHYLARLARSSRCYSCCPYALHCAVRLFVYYFNQRQLRKH